MLEHMLFKGTRKVGTTDFENEKKYIEVINAWAVRMDEWRRKEAALRAEGNTEEADEAGLQARRWKARIGAMSQKARDFMIMDEDSYLYSLHGQRGYNAYTSRDLTNYQIELPVNRLEVWARLESDRFKNPVLRDFYTERDVVAEERRMRVDNVASSLLMEGYMNEIFQDHPYGRSLIGKMESIQFLNHEMAEDFYKTYYNPANMVIAMVGDIDFDREEALVRKYFSSMQRMPEPPRPLVKEPEKRIVRYELKKEGSPYQLLGWFKPAMPHPDDLRLEILARVLAGRRDSRLFRKLVVEDRIVSQIDAYSSYPGERYSNMFLILTVPAPGRTYEEAEAGVMDVISDIHRDGITEDELERVRAALESEMIYSLRSNSSLANRLSFYEIVTGDYRSMFTVYKELADLTVQDIQDVARKYIRPEFIITARLLPPDEDTKK